MIEAKLTVIRKTDTGTLIDEDWGTIELCCAPSEGHAIKVPRDGEWQVVHVSYVMHIAAKPPYLLVLADWKSIDLSEDGF